MTKLHNSPPAVARAMIGCDGLPGAPRCDDPPVEGLRGGPRCRSLCEDQRGATALEFALLLPLLLMFFVGLIDAGVVFFTYNDMQKATRTAARALAVGSIVSQGDAQTMVENEMSTWGATPTVQVVLPNPADPTDTQLTVTVSVGTADVIPVDVAGLLDTTFGSVTLTSRVSMRKQD